MSCFKPWNKQERVTESKYTNSQGTFLIFAGQPRENSGAAKILKKILKYVETWWDLTEATGTVEDFQIRASAELVLSGPGLKDTNA